MGYYWLTLDGVGTIVLVTTFTAGGL